jgi:hypothetical protein
VAVFAISNLKFEISNPVFAGRKMVGVTGVEPVTLRLSSACSNQLSYTPILNFGLLITDSGLKPNPKSKI